VQVIQGEEMLAEAQPPCIRAGGPGGLSGISQVTGLAAQVAGHVLGINGLDHLVRPAPGGKQPSLPWRLRHGPPWDAIGTRFILTG
jgi:hypothetical protein